MTTTVDDAPRLGDWVCLGVLYGRHAHGWAVVKQLRPDGEIGRIWHLSRPLTYRAIDHLEQLGWIRPVGEERGDGGPNRTILAVTQPGRSRFEEWVRTPVDHLRDLRSELLLKLVFADRYGIDNADMLERQQSIIDRQARALVEVVSGVDADVVALWRLEATLAAQRFLARVVGE